MKTSTLLLLLALGMGQAWGQKSVPCIDTQILPFTVFRSDGTTKRYTGFHSLKEIGPDSALKECAWLELSKKPVPVGTYGVFDGEHWIPLLNDLTDPIDVPAIQETRPIDKDNFRPCGTGWWITSSYGKEGRWCSRTTCADKTRILEHNEQDQPKYYCRRPQL